MKTNTCNICGSHRVRADRALAGKLICLNCGRTLSEKKYRNAHSKTKTSTISKFIVITIGIILIIVII